MAFGRRKGISLDIAICDPAAVPLPPHVREPARTEYLGMLHGISSRMFLAAERIALVPEGDARLVLHAADRLVRARSVASLVEVIFVVDLGPRDGDARAAADFLAAMGRAPCAPARSAGGEDSRPELVAARGALDRLSDVAARAFAASPGGLALPRSQRAVAVAEAALAAVVARLREAARYASSAVLAPAGLRRVEHLTMIGTRLARAGDPLMACLRAVGAGEAADALGDLLVRAAPPTLASPETSLDALFLRDADGPLPEVAGWAAGVAGYAAARRSA